MDKTMISILKQEFRGIALERLLLVRDPESTAFHLYARPQIRAPNTTAAYAFEAFRNATDRLMVESPKSPYLVWYGLEGEDLVRGAHEVEL